MFKNNFVVSIKCNNNFLRDINNEVRIPFGSEYSIYLKNLESRKAVVNVSVDGKSVLDGKQIIINPNRPFELKGFLKNDTIKNKFKFIQKTKEISDYRGDNIDDGIIRVEYTFEKVIKNIKVNYSNSNEYHYYHYPQPYIIYTPPKIYEKYEWYCESVSTNQNSCDWTIYNTPQNNLEDIHVYNCSNSVPLKDEGITVKGSEVNQIFNIGFTEELEKTSSVISIILKGYSNGYEIKKPIITDTKLTCSSCGKKSKSNCKFCSRCGTYLL